MHIYIITNKIDGKKYVGQTVRNNPQERIDEHFRDNPLNSSPYLHFAIQKYGKDNFDIEIIPYLGANQDALDSIEVWQIKKNNSLSPNGYNLMNGGRGGKHSKETRDKISKANTGRKFSNETKNRMSKAKSGKNHPFFGKKLSKEHKQKLHNAQKGEKNHNYGKIGTFTGKSHSEVTIKKIRKALSNKRHFAWKHKEEIKQLRNQGWKYQKLAGKYNCGISLIETICKSI